MIPTSKQDLSRIAKEQGYRPEILEKVYRLLTLIEHLMAAPFLRERLALKGGTAINLFCTDTLPRLSLDADFNYIGSNSVIEMMQDKEKINQMIVNICERSGHTLRRNPRSHAGGKMVLSYPSLLGTQGRLELDLNYLYRSPLWPVQTKQSAHQLHQVSVPLLDIHELAAGKLHALLNREASRDLFDSHELLLRWELDDRKLRSAFTVYTAMGNRNWKTINTNLIKYSTTDIQNKLVPVLKQDIVPKGAKNQLRAWADQIISQCITAFDRLLPFSANEIQFLRAIEEGSIQPDLLSTDVHFCHAVKKHPAILWRMKQLENA